MSESFKDQSVPGEVSSELREDLPSPHLGWSHDSVAPGSLPAHRVDGSIIERHIPLSESGDDLPLDASSGHKGLHCPLAATESPDQSLRLRTFQPYDPGRVRLGSLDLRNRVERDRFELNQVSSEHAERGPVTDAGGTTDGIGFVAALPNEPFQEKGDVPLGELLGTEPLAGRDKLSDLGFVFRLPVPFLEDRVKVNLALGFQKLRKAIGFIRGVEIGQRQSLQDYELQRLPLESSLQGPNHLLDRQRGPVVGSAAGMASPSLVGEVEAGFPDRASFGSERHSGAEDAPTDAPRQEAVIYSWGVTLYPGRDLNSHGPYEPRDFERHGQPFSHNGLGAFPSVGAVRVGYPASTKSNRGVPR